MALFINTTLATMRVAAGEPIVFSYQPQNGSGVAESLDGRSFVFSIYDNSRNNLGVYNAIVKTLPKPRALWKLSGNISEALLGKPRLGSGLVDHSQKMTVAARAMAEKKAVGHRS